ncbi:flagellar hook-associated protein FlgK [Pseudomonas congelans]|jgi:flagellar hook-associated protein 1 FlgK|uniref:flagellar hook-associated protein FlgK n=1 Tax=Pseudomonas congelans TaxID=200452 RepID=UPI0001E29075|nr:flagellar hook-associated protein FlgK [Pseudomonas congelans]MCF5165549.1 flagellar hook-associated protein FlgK [Pseudomonas congelans]PBQ10518.1 flagellar hook-associated protein FlgK [Pseudomonas congelans]PBQ16708.1 flagellar hook-associated protein FlgK [Pseudomonas congelans]PBQ17233.1 flagellar hook-associated protein FlgK [Pseudomonas congelans]QVX16329.1 flagellar hook-associated protein FlgK [Pseudomonas congelans]
MSLISIGLSGINASSAAINTIGNNTANVDTAGYSRQQVLTTASAQIALGQGTGYIGTGTTLSDVRRIYNSYLDTQLQTTTALSADAVAYSGQASKTDTLLSDSATGIATQLSDFFTKMQGIATNATQSSDRSSFLTQANALSARFNSIASQLSSQNDNVNAQLANFTTQVNELTNTVASLNKQITQASAGNGTPNTLLDSRSEAVRQLNELVGVKVSENNGNYDVYTGTGQALVSGSTAYKMSTAPSAADPLQYNVQIAYGQTQTDVSSVVTGGSIGGLLRYRSDVLVPAANELGRTAMVLSDQVNSQMSQGIDSKGNFGSNLYSSINGADAITQRSIGKTTNSAGSGNLDVTIGDTSKLTADDYEVTFNDASNFTVRRLPNGESVGTGSLADNPPKQFEGFSVSLNGNTLAAGDIFKVTPTRNGASGISVVLTDAKDIAAAAPLTATAGTSNSGTGGFTQPVLNTKSDIYNSTQTADLRNAVKNSTPMKVVMGAVSSTGVQSYTLLNASGGAVLDQNGNAVGGSIIQGQSNKLKLSIGYTDTTTTPSSKTAFELEMTISGSPVANDTFSIGMTGAGSSDNRNALAVVGLQTAKTVGATNGSVGTSLSGSYADLVSVVGTLASQGKNDVTATAAVVGQAKASRDSVSGVSLDEEASNLIKYQQYYTASSQIIKAAQTIFSTLINSL